MDFNRLNDGGTNVNGLTNLDKSQNGAKQWGGLNLDNYGATMQGGGSGKGVCSFETEIDQASYPQWLVLQYTVSSSLFQELDRTSPYTLASRHWAMDSS